MKQIDDELKRLANQYLKDSSELDDASQKEVRDKFLFWETDYCNGCEIDVILRGGGGLVGKSYDYGDIEWI